MNITAQKHLSFREVAIAGTAFGALAIGAFAIGALAIGRLAIRRVLVGDAEFKSLRVQDLTITRLHVGEVMVTDSVQLPLSHVDPKIL